MNRIMTRFLFCILFFAVIGLWSCSGGGGGDEAGDVDGLRRDTATAMRIIHAAVDAPPVDIYMAGTLVQRARFSESKNYVRVTEGPSQIVVTNATDPAAILKAISSDLLKETEYTLLVYGEAATERLKVILLPDNVIRPAKGRCLIRLVNGLTGADKLNVKSSAVSIDDTAFGKASQFVDTSCGPQVLSVLSHGQEIKSTAVDIPEQGELTLLVSGSRALGAAFTTNYLDLD